MTEPVIVALIAAAQVVLLALIARWTARNTKAVEAVAHNTNAIKDELVEATRVEARNAVLLEVAELKARLLIETAAIEAARKLSQGGTP